MSMIDTSVSNLDISIWDKSPGVPISAELQKVSSPNSNIRVGFLKNFDDEKRQNLAWAVVDVCKLAIFLGLVILSNMLVNPELNLSEICYRAWTNLTFGLFGGV